MEAMATLCPSHSLVCTGHSKTRTESYEVPCGSGENPRPSHSSHRRRSAKLRNASCGRSSVEQFSSSWHGRCIQNSHCPYCTVSALCSQAGSSKPSSGGEVLPLWTRNRNGTLKGPECSGRNSKFKNVIQAANVEVATTTEVGNAKAETGVSSELLKLLDLVPQHLRDKLQEHAEIEQLVEIVLDLGRKPMARFPSGDWFISQDLVTSADLEHAVSLVGEFADDNRAGMDRTLHRISAIRNRAGRIVGLTCRVGRAISGSAEMVRDLVASGGSLLLMGPPGVGKTTAIREVARMLADEYHKRVVIVDTSNEIAGDGDIPHAGIGRARRMQVPKVELQHEVMIEAVENHMPQTIVIDEIGTELEAFAAGTIAQRGVQLVGTAHGMTVENLIKNPSLQILAGGIQSVTLGDEEARRRNVQKSVLERKGPPTFTVAVEMVSRNEWKVHRSLAATIDYLLAGRPPKIEYRRMTSEGKLIIGNEEIESPSGVGSSGSQFAAESGSDDESDDEDDDSDDDESETTGKGQQGWDTGDTPLYLYTYQVTDASLEQVMEVMGLEKSVQITNDIGAADVVLALRSKLKQNPWVRGMAKYRQLPVFAIKANTMAQMVRAMRAILGMESLAANTLVSSRTRLEEVPGLHNPPRKATSEDEIDALEEARLAIEQLVIPKGQPVELLPRTPEIIALQIKLVEGYQLATEKAGTEFNVRLRILPKASEGGMYEAGKRDEWDEEVNVEGEIPTVADTKRAFLDAYRRPIPSIYSSVIQELIVQQHLMRYNTTYKYDSVFALGFVTVYDQLMDGYPSSEDRDAIFKAYISALKEDPEKYRTDAKKLEEWASEQTSASIVCFGDGEVGAILKDISERAGSKDKFHYSRFFAIGLFRLLEVAKASDPAVLEQLSKALNVSKSSIDRDLDVYRNLLSKLAQAKELLKEYVDREKKKALERETAAAKKTEEVAKTEAKSE